jgi:hypothetical protein
MCQKVFILPMNMTEYYTNWAASSAFPTKLLNNKNQ